MCLSNDFLPLASQYIIEHNSAGRDIFQSIRARDIGILITTCSLVVYTNPLYRLKVFISDISSDLVCFGNICQNQSYP